MNEQVRALQPSALWNHFADLNAVPRPSKKEERVIEFIVQFGKSLGLPTEKDGVGNVVIRKRASKGMEGLETVALQGHLDMVHQKNAGTNFDFDQEGIRMKVNGDWVKAEGTTLGADNGIGVAAMMALLSSKDIPHPALEALFTIDEETGMTGALSLKPEWLTARIMLNLDTEDDRELTIGCAGGVDVSASGMYSQTEAQAKGQLYTMAVKGLTGGHSGMDIHKGRANANKLMNRIVWAAAERFGASVASIDGGSLRNAIPRESVCTLLVPLASSDEFEDFVNTEAAVLKAEYASTDPNLAVTCSRLDGAAKVMDAAFQRTLLRALYACPNGIYRMSPDISGLVQTSNNLARVLVKDGAYSIQCLTRSSVDSEKMDLAQAIRSTFELTNMSVTFTGAYPGWTPQPGSAVVKLMSSLYKEMYKEDALVNACHAGLECGIIGRNYPQMQMISFGPNIHGAHSPDETVQISSVQKFWKFLLETLKRMPEKGSMGAAKPATTP